jgi:hypothetical protein
VAALVAVVGLVIACGVFDIPVLAPKGDGAFGDASTAGLALGPPPVRWLPRGADTSVTATWPTPATTAPGSNCRGDTRRLSNRICSNHQTGTSSTNRTTLVMTGSAGGPRSAEVSRPSTMTCVARNDIPVRPLTMWGRPRGAGSPHAASYVRCSDRVRLSNDASRTTRPTTDRARWRWAAG